MLIAEASLTARQGAPMRDEGVRTMVESSARAIAERTGVRLVDVSCDESSVRVQVEGEEIVAVGLASELRRVTDAWHVNRYGRPLWGPAA